MLLFYLLIISGCFYLIFKDDKKSLYDLSREKTDTLKAYLALSVLVGHLSFLVRGDFPYSSLYGLGLVAVNSFLFISGYGLFISLRNKGSQYISMKNIAKRLKKIVLPFLIASVIYLLLVYTFLGKDVVVGKFYQFSSGWIDSLLPFSWYVYSIVFFYISFYILSSFTKDIGLIILLLSIAVVGYIVFINKFLHLPSYWTRSSFSFILGALFVCKEDKIISIFRRNVKLIYLLIGICCICFCKWDMTEDSYLYNIFLSLSVILVSTPIIQGARWLSFVGKISYEIYLTQGTGMFICQYVFKLNAISYGIYFCVTIICVLFISYLLSLIVSTINRIGSPT